MRWWAAALAASILSAGCDPAGSEPVPGGVDLTIAEGLTGPYDLVWDREAFAVVYAHAPPPSDVGETDTDALVFARVRGDGTVLTPPRVVQDLDVDAHAIRITTGSDGYLVWYRARSSPVHVLSLTAAGDAAGAPTVVADATFTDRGIAVARGESGYGLLYVSSTSPTDLAFQAVTSAGQPDGASVPIEERAAEQRGAALAAAATPDLFTAVWMEGTVLYGATLGADGAIVDPGVRINPTNRNYDPIVATIDASSYLVLARDSGLDSLRLYVVRDGTSISDEPFEPVPENRGVDVLYDVHVDGGIATLAYRSNFEHGLGQIVVATLDLSTVTVTETRLLTNPRYGWGDLALSRGDSGFGLVFNGVVDGSQRVYFAAVPD